ncbi:MAG: response regulator [Candidatus Zixiibacteriota bacterium]
MDNQPIMVLLVEDNPDHAELVKRSLAAYPENNRMLHVTDGEQALDYLFRRGVFADTDEYPEPDIILLDLRLPKVEGQEVLRQIRHSKQHKNLPVVILTTSGAEDDINKAYENQVNSYLVKPVDFDKFTRLMKDLSYYWLGWNTFPGKELIGQAGI